MAILAIGIPILAAIRMPIRQKAVLLVVFGMGFFVIVAAILTKVYCLVPSLISYVYMNWYFREASVAMYVTNLPTIWPLLRDIFPHLRSIMGSHSKTNTDSNMRPWVDSRSHARVNSGGFAMQPYSKNSTRAESQERINDGDSDKSLDSRTLKIQLDVSYTVQSETAEGGTSDNAAAHRAWDKQKAATAVVLGNSKLDC